MSKKFYIYKNHAGCKSAIRIDSIVSVGTNDKGYRVYFKDVNIGGNSNIYCLLMTFTEGRELIESLENE